MIYHYYNLGNTINIEESFSGQTDRPIEEISNHKRARLLLSYALHREFYILKAYIKCNSFGSLLEVFGGEGRKAEDFH